MFFRPEPAVRQIARNLLKAGARNSPLAETTKGSPWQGDNKIETTEMICVWRR